MAGQGLEFSRGVSDAIVRTDPHLYTTTFSKVGRERKILIDYLRNNRTNIDLCLLASCAGGSGRLHARRLARIEHIARAVELPTAVKRLERLRGDPWVKY